ncbi:hypothetical protein [Oceanicaulis sp.]|uniref:hypothetical protein n=1 Tax=Oceanicaulis sp. TaxID=1924941 RepID=UPI003F72A2A8
MAELSFTQNILILIFGVLGGFFSSIVLDILKSESKNTSDKKFALGILIALHNKCFTTMQSSFPLGETIDNCDSHNKLRKRSNQHLDNFIKQNEKDLEESKRSLMRILPFDAESIYYIDHRIQTSINTSFDNICSTDTELYKKLMKAIYVLEWSNLNRDKDIISKIAISIGPITWIRWSLYKMNRDYVKHEKKLIEEVLTDSAFIALKEMNL